MAAKDPELRRQVGRYGQAVRWGKVVDRTQETAPARDASPASPPSSDYWVKKLDPELFATATDQQRYDAADCLRRAHYLKMALQSAQARKKAS